MRPPQGLLLVEVGDHWAAYSPQSGETILLNNEGAAVLEILSRTPCDVGGVCAILSSDVGLEVEALEALIHPLWQQLIEAGVLQEAAERV